MTACGLDAGCGAQFGPGIVEVKVDGLLGRVQYDSDFGGCFPARSPGQHLDLAIAHVDELRPYLIAGNACKARTDNGLKNIKIDRLVTKSSARSPMRWAC